MESAPWLVSGRTPWRVMIVDDEDLVRSILADMVQLSGYQVCGQARDGFEATRIVGAADPDVILMDIVMPTMDGLEALEIINATHPTCALFLSAYCSPHLLERATTAGAQGYLVKPCQPSDLVPAIETAIAQFQRSRIAADAGRIERHFQRAWAHARDGGNVGAAIEQALASAFQEVGHSQFALAVRRGTRLYALVARGTPSATPGTILGPADGPLGRALQQQTPSQCQLPNMPGGSTAILSAPLIASPGFQGCLYVFAPETHRFSRREEHLVGVVAQAAATLLQRLQADRPQPWRRWLHDRLGTRHAASARR